MTAVPPDLDRADHATQEPADTGPPPSRTVTTVAGPPTTDAAGQAERDRVLRHPDIAARLCQPPLSYPRPEDWQGFIPPSEWGGKRNDSRRREALLDIVAAAVEADREASDADTA